MRTVIIYHRQFEFAVKRCGHYRLPFHNKHQARVFRFVPDSDQISRSVAGYLFATMFGCLRSSRQAVRLGGLGVQAAGRPALGEGDR